jgi:hypothetical protein
MKKRRIVITDLTRMQHGNVCVAGYDTDKHCIRLMLPPHGFAENYLYQGQQPVLFPFAVIECDLLTHMPDPPHTEDWSFDSWSLNLLQVLAPEKRASVLGWSLAPTVEAIFDQPLHAEPGWHVAEGSGTRSLGTLKPTQVEQIRYEPGLEGTWDFRVVFRDEVRQYNLKITDLTWSYFGNSLRNEQTEPQQVAQHLTHLLKNREVYLRIGLSRGWKKFPGKCFLQVNGIHTVPDYLEGKTFADFRPSKGLTLPSV